MGMRPSAGKLHWEGTANALTMSVGIASSRKEAAFVDDQSIPTKTGGCDIWRGGLVFKELTTVSCREMIILTGIFLLIRILVVFIHHVFFIFFVVCVRLVSWHQSK